MREADRAVLAMIESIAPQDVSAHYELAVRQVHHEPTPHDVFDLFIGNEKQRFIKATHVITATRQAGRVCDWGCFLPYLPIVLARLGYEVTILDNYALFGPSFREAIFTTARSFGLRVVDADMLSDDLTGLGSFDIALLMAVVEHLLGSPQRLLQTINKTLTPTGHLLFEVPNIAELSKRIAFLLGRSPLPDYRQYLDADYPFRGHHREMTTAEVDYLLNATGYTVKHKWCYDYWTPSKRQPLVWAFAKLKPLLPVPDKGQAIMALAAPSVRGR